MAVTLAKTNFTGGEISPSLWGLSQNVKIANGCSVLRNCWVNFRGGVSSRAGFRFVGPSGQTGRAFPPRLIPFNFNVITSFNLEFGNFYMRIMSKQGYVLETGFSITAISNATAAVLTVPSNNFNAGDLIFLSSIGGMGQVDGRFFLVASAAGPSVIVSDIFGGSEDSSSYPAYTGGGIASRVYTVVSPYAEADLAYLKYAQSASVMSMTCVNQATGAEYPPYDIARVANANWTITRTSYDPVIGPPTNVTGQPWLVDPGAVTNRTQYGYVVTAVDKATSAESIASKPVYVNTVDFSLGLNNVAVSWNHVQGASEFNIYKAPPAAAASTVPIGSVFGLVGTSLGHTFVDANITQDMTVTPPLHLGPFERGQIIAATPVSGGSGYSQSTVAATVVTSTGSGAVLIPVIVAGAVVSIIIQENGKNYLPGDTISITGGAGASFTPVVGPETGTYPSVVSYFQSRRAYANSLNNPDTLWLSQTGQFTNMDAGEPPRGSDAITMTPFGEQVNGIQWMIQMPGGLLVATARSVWQIYGNAGAGSPVTPSSQTAASQESTGFNAIVPPVKINYDIIYLQAIGSVIRQLQYNFFANIFAGQDISFQSNHLFEGRTIIQNAWQREPNKLLWWLRDDGRLLSLTYLKEQEVIGFGRHDTNGEFVSCSSITESTSDSLYVAVNRYIAGAGKWAYYIERADDRIWPAAENTFCVDAGIALTQPTPSASITLSAADGPGIIINPSVVFGGQNYSSMAAALVSDPSGSGSGASLLLTIVGGVITGVSVLTGGTGYEAVEISIVDTIGTGASITASIDDTITVTASAAVFSSGDVGSVLRAGGGIATVTAFISATEVTVNVSSPFPFIPNDPNQGVAVFQSGDWTLTKPITSVVNAHHLNGMTISCLADGSVVSPQVVVGGSFSLPFPASSVVYGLGFIAQVQSLHADAGGQVVVQGKRKRVSGVTARMSASRGVTLGANQPVASALQGAPDVSWNYMEIIKDRTNAISAGSAIPLFTGDAFMPISDSWDYDLSGSDQQASPGFIAFQQTNPLPMNVSGAYFQITLGDTDG